MVDVAGRDVRPVRARRGASTGVLIAIISAAAFSTSGVVARSLLDGGWSPGAVVTLRIGVAAAVMVVPTVLALRGNWGVLRRQAGMVLGYGAFAVAGAQLAYFSAIQHLSVGVALMIEYLAPVLVVGYVWARTGRRPGRLTTVGVGLSLVGLALVLDLAGDVRVSPIGVGYALMAAMGLAVYFIFADDDTDDAVPPIALAGTGLVVGAVLLAVAGLTGLLPMRASTADVQLAGATVPWWVPGLELAVVAGAFAYVLGIRAVRSLGSTVASFVALTEVLFAVLFAWFLLGELPVAIQLLGGALIVAGVVAVRMGDAVRTGDTEAATPAPPAVQAEPVHDLLTPEPAASRTPPPAVVAAEPPAR